MIPELARTLRRENPILEPFLDRLKEIVDYTEAILHRAEADCFVLITYRGPIPQVDTLSLSFAKSGLADWVSAIETGEPAISDGVDATIVQDARNRAPIEQLIGRPSGSSPRSLLAVPLASETGSSYLLVLTQNQPRFYTPELAGRVLRFAQEHLRTIENSVRHIDLAQRAADAEILLSVQRAIASQLDLRAVQRLIVDEARQLAFSRSALLFSLEGDVLTLEAFSDERPDLTPGCDRWQLGGASIVDLEGPIRCGRVEAAPLLGAPAADWIGERDFVAAPLRHGAHMIGLLIVVDKRLGVFDRWDERRLAMLTSVAAVCLENARLYQQAGRMAALEERDRLSREMHDELAQALSYLKMQASLVEQKVWAGDREGAQEHLTELKGVLDNAYSSVREAIFGLRHQIAAGSDFFTSLNPFLANYRRHYGLNVTLEMALDPPPELAPEVELQLARIVQESLANVRRHAAATEVRVKVEREPGCLIVRIADDGRGFDVDAVLSADGHRYGLQIMRERAESFGGRVQIQSVPCCGSEVTVYMPESLE